MSQRVAMTMTVVARPKSARAESGPEGIVGIAGVGGIVVTKK